MTEENAVTKASTIMIVALCSAAFVASYSESMMNIALSSIMGEFGVDSITAQWLATGYLIISANMVAIAAFLQRRFALRPLFMTSGTLFIIGAVVAALAPNFIVLMVFRMVQACGTGIFVALMASNVLIIAPREKLGMYMSACGVVMTVGPALAPFVSGAMVTAMGWRGVFVPPCVAMVLAVILGFLFLRNTTEPQKVKLDGLSLLLSVVGLVFFMYGLTQIVATPLVALGFLLVGAGIIVIFIHRQNRLEKPLLNMAPIRNWRFIIGSTMTMLGMMAPFASSICGPLYFQDTLGMDAVFVGSFYFVAAICNALIAVPSGKLYDKRGEWPLLPAGVLVGTCGVVATIAAIHLGWIWLVYVGAALISITGGMIFMPGQTAGLRFLPQEMNADGVSIINVLVQIAACVGGSLFVGVQTSSTSLFAAGGASAASAACNGFTTAMLVLLAIFIVMLVVAVRFARTCEKECKG